MLLRPEIIHKKATDLVRRCGTRNTLRIAEEAGIYLRYVNNFEQLLGMYLYQHKERHILLNSNMETMVMQMVCGHEIGHDYLHRDLAKQVCMQEFELFDIRNDAEYEANAFAAHLLIDDENLICWMKEGYDVVQLASTMNVNANLMLVKLNELNRMGWHLKLPYVPYANFLNRIVL